MLAGTLAGGLVLIALTAAMLMRPWWRAAVAVFLPFAVVLGWWLTLAPSQSRDWQSDVARLPTVTLNGSLLTVRNVRDFAYRKEMDFTERWETRTYDLDTLVGFDMFVSFWGPTLYGHTIASWEFADGGHLRCRSRRARRRARATRRCAACSASSSSFIVGDERDIIGVRVAHRGETVHLYRVGRLDDEARDLLLAYVRELNDLGERPRWYNALTHNCTTTIWHHTKAVGSATLDWRLLANGYLLDLAYERGTVNTRIPLDELKRRSDITARARSATDREDFSAAIREGLPPRPEPRR